MTQSMILYHVSAVDNVIQRAGMKSLQPTIPYLAHHRVLAGHICEPQVYDTLRQEQYRTHMVDNVHQPVKDCQAFSKEGTR